MDQQEMKKRTKEFALRIMKLVGALPQSIEGRAVGNQLVRAGTSVGANYRAACRGRSRAEFIAKLGLVEEEADESAFWLEIIIEGNLLKKHQAESLLKEANELVAIIAASRKSAKGLSLNLKSAIENRK
jgi:four helix bundle protein